MNKLTQEELKEIINEIGYQSMKCKTQNELELVMLSQFDSLLEKKVKEAVERERREIVKKIDYNVEGIEPYDVRDMIINLINSRNEKSER